MNYKIVIQEQAQHDVSKALEWYLERNTVVAKAFKEQLFSALEKIAHDPMLYQLVHKKNRKIALRPFPYNLYFEVRGGEILVRACIHMSRSSKVWKKRLR